MTKEDYQNLSIAELQDHLDTLQPVLTKKLREAKEHHYYANIPFLVVDQPSPVTGRIYLGNDELRQAIDEFNRNPRPVTLETDTYMHELTQLHQDQFRESRPDQICGSVVDLKLSEYGSGRAIVGTLRVHGPKHAEAMALIGDGIPKLAMRALTRGNIAGELSIVELVTWDLVDDRE